MAKISHQHKYPVLTAMLVQVIPKSHGNNCPRKRLAHERPQLLYLQYVAVCATVKSRTEKHVNLSLSAVDEGVEQPELLLYHWGERTGTTTLEKDLSLSEKVNLSVIYAQAIPRRGFGSNTSLACVHQETKGAHRHPVYNGRKTERWKQARCAPIIK